MDAFGKFLVHVPPGAYVEALDLSGDGKVDLFDIPALKGLFDFLSGREKVRYLVYYQAGEWQEVVKEFVRLLTQSGPNREYNPAFDLNGDGSIDGLDIEPFTRLFGLLRWEEPIRYRLLLIKAAYAGEDGELSAEEYMAAVDAFEKFLAHGSGDYEALWDVNGDGKVDLFDIPTLKGLFDFLSDGEKARFRAYEAVDQDGDGVLTAAEMVNAQRGLLASWGKNDSQYDFDRSGMVSGDDLDVLLVLVAQMPEWDQYLLRAYEVVANGNFDVTAGEWIAALRGLQAALGSQAGDERYDARYDFNHSGGIAVNDAAILRALIPLLADRERAILNAYLAVDEDGNGVLTASEVVGALQGLRAARGKKEGKAGYNPLYDFDRSGRIDGADSKILLSLLPVMSEWERNVVRAYLAISGGDWVLSASELRKAIREFGRSLGKKRGERGYRAKWDFDHSGTVTVKDAAILRALLSLVRR